MEKGRKGEGERESEFNDQVSCDIETTERVRMLNKLEIGMSMQIINTNIANSSKDKKQKIVSVVGENLGKTKKGY